MHDLKIKKNDLTGNYNISASPMFVWGFVIVLCCVVCLFVFGIVSMGVQKSRMSKLQKIQAENIQLRRKLDHYATQIDSIMTILDKIQKKNDNNAKNKFESLQYKHPDLEAETLTDSDFYYDSYLYAQNHYVAQKLSNIESYLPDLMRQEKMGKPAPVTEEDKLAETPSIYPTFGRISDCFGNRLHPIYHEMIFHYGLDFANKIGTPVYATAAGIVAFSGYDQYYGRIIKISHGKDYETRYAHLSRSSVLSGDEVKKGQIIGYVGDSGLSTGPHLHYEIIAYGQKVNPNRYLDTNASSLITKQTSGLHDIIR
ncbi:MAG TPA: M23 family metallopeptidase [Candidatus Cloacimonadota bacterium]|nr:M23 family metallopeptidase [Candidatus Cloacimonadota bacterium]HPT72485.1 M23 family metallopeptidase [Candidatus Cloacimonadota bacterium]